MKIKIILLNLYQIFVELERNTKARQRPQSVGLQEFLKWI